jgi:hypothetical protein
VPIPPAKMTTFKFAPARPDLRNGAGPAAPAPSDDPVYRYRTTKAFGIIDPVMYPASRR